MDGASLARIYEALSALSRVWAHTFFVPKRAVIPMMQVDSVFCEMNDPQHELPDDLPDSLGDLLVEMEHMLVGDNLDGVRLAQLAAGQSERTTEWALSSGLHDETLARVYDFLTGEDGVMFDGMVVLPLTEENTQYPRSIFQTLVERHGNSQRIPRALATLLIGLKGHLVTWRRSPKSSIQQAELADELLDLTFQYLSGPLDHSPRLKPGDSWADDRRTSALAWSYTIMSWPEATSTSVNFRRPCGRMGVAHRTNRRSRAPGGAWRFIPMAEASGLHATNLITHDQAVDGCRLT
jgi:hypothetical protein